MGVSLAGTGGRGYCVRYLSSETSSKGSSGDSIADTGGASQTVESDKGFDDPFAAASKFGIKRLTPEVPPDKLTVRVGGSGASRFGTGFARRVIRFLRLPSADVNFDFRRWAIHTGYWRHLEKWLPVALLRSPELRRIMFPDVAQVGIVAGFITWYNQMCAAEVLKILDTNNDGEVCKKELREGIEQGLVEAHFILGNDFYLTPDMLLIGTTVPFTLTSLAIGMMLTFRMQHCNQRYCEARATWGAMTNETRAVASRILALVRSHTTDTAMHKSAVHAVKCFTTFPYLLKHHLTVDGYCPDLHITLEMTDAEVDEAKCAVLRMELASIWDMDDEEDRAFVDRILGSGIGNRPLHVLQEISELNGQVLARKPANGDEALHPVHIDHIYRSVSRMQDVLGVCERIYKTPIYSGYTHFTSRCVFLWTNLVPLSLYPVLGPHGTIPASILVAMFLYGLEDVGARIEEPFGSLPLWQYCEGIASGCKQTLAQHFSIVHGGNKSE